MPLSDQTASGLYSAGDCPVCADSGVVLLLKDVATDRLFFFCPLCGVAWRSPPSGRRLDQIESLREVAPSGVILPTESEAAASKVSLTRVAPGRWLSMIEDELRAEPDEA